jgi:hypothetical protein
MYLALATKVSCPIPLFYPGDASDVVMSGELFQGVHGELKRCQ